MAAGLILINCAVFSPSHFNPTGILSNFNVAGGYNLVLKIIVVQIYKQNLQILCESEIQVQISSAITLRCIQTRTAICRCG